MRIPLPLIASLALAAAPLAMPTALAADAAHGKALFEKCANCHAQSAADEGGADVGPDLKGVFGRKAATVEGYRYSLAMRRSNIVWDEASLKEYINNPQQKVKGNRMPFTGYPAASDVDDIIEYLKTLK